MSQLYRGEISGFDFISEADATVNTWFTFEWHDAIEVYGLQPSEMTDAERDALAAEINRQITFLIPFMNDILNARNADRPLTPLLQRVELWVNDLGRIRQLAQNMAAADQKAEWVLGPTEQHCPSCSYYAGKVYRRSVWTRWLEPAGLMPRTKGPESGLACGGWNCLCELIDTDKPVTPGRPAIRRAKAHEA